MVFLSARGPALGARFGAKRFVSAGFCVVPFGLLGLSFMSETKPYWCVAACLIVMAVGPALAIPTLSSGIVLSLPLDKAGVGSAVNDTTREVGGAIGIAVLGSILSSHYRSGIGPALAGLSPEAAQVAEVARRVVGPLAGLIDAAPGIPQFKNRLPELQGLYTVARHEFVGGMQVGFRVAAAAMVLVAAAIITWYPHEELVVGSRPGGH